MPRKVEEDRFELANELTEDESYFLEQEETKLAAIRSKLATGESQLDKGQFIDDESFIAGLIIDAQTRMEH